MTTLVKRSEGTPESTGTPVNSDVDSGSSRKQSTSSEINEETSWSRQSSLFSIFTRKSSLSDRSSSIESTVTTDSSRNSSTFSTEGIGGRLWGSNGFWELKDNFLSRIEAALQSSSPTQTPVRKVVKDRSVFGQPEITIPINSACHPARIYRELSRESLETLDSGHSLTSCRISSADLKHLESYDTLKPYRYRNHSGDGGCDSAGIGSSIESSDIEDVNDESAQEEEDDETSRCESRASMASTSSDDSQVAMKNREIKEFMRDFVKGIFDTG